MNTFPKFIIENNPKLGYCLIIGKVKYHKELALDEKNIVGGGWWILKVEEKETFIFYGESHDYGIAKFDDIKKCFENKMILKNKYSKETIIDDFDFKYKDVFGKIFDL